MSGSAIIRALLVADSAVTAAIPAARIKSGVLDEGTQLPAIGIVTVSFVERKTVKTEAKVRVTERVQVSILAADYASVKALPPKVRKACRNKRSSGSTTIDNCTGVLVMVDSEGPDIRAETIGAHMKSQDFLVTYDEAT
jgi:hypothetical protein